MPIGKTDHRPKPKSMRAAGTAASALWRRYSWFESMRGSHPFFSEGNSSQSRFSTASKLALEVCCRTVKTPKKVISAWKKCYRVLHDLRVKASWYETRKCWRVLVPPSDSEPAAVLVVFDDQSNMKIKTAGPATIPPGGKIKSAIEAKAEFKIDFENGSSATLCLADPGSSVAVRDKNNAVEYLG